MKRKTKRRIATGFVLIAIALLTSFILIVFNQINTPEIPAIITSPTVTATIETEPYGTSISEKTTTPNPTAESIPTVNPTLTVAPTKPSNTSVENQQAIAQISIERDIKTRTYDVMPEVEEETLKHDLGHLPTSAMPGQEGLCVIMGHRDTQFSILQYCEIGNSITLKSDDRFYVYTVYSIEIIENDSALQFDAVNGANLALVTCYPFHYTGHAPQKIIVYARFLRSKPTSKKE